jgi:hypothetical protein
MLPPVLLRTLPVLPPKTPWEFEEEQAATRAARKTEPSQCRFNSLSNQL